MRHLILYDLKASLSGSNADWDDPNPYSNQKFESISGTYRSIFQLAGAFFQVLFDSKSYEISFRISRTEDLTSFTDDPIGVNVNIQELFSYILFLIEKLIKQISPPYLTFVSKSHTKKLYAGFYKSKALNDEATKLGYERVSTEDLPDGSSRYVYKRK